MTDIIETTINTEIAEYNATAAALADLRSKYEKVIFPVETPKGMKDALSARKELRDLRVSLEKLRKEIKEPALRRCQLIDSEAKEITAQLTSLEDPIDKQIKVEERRKEAEKAERERIERERVANIRTKIDFIKRLPLDSANDPADHIKATIDELDTLEIDDSYAEFKSEAEAAKNAALLALGSLYTTTKDREEEDARLKAEREELDRQRAELERQRAEIEAAKAPEPEPEPVVEETPAEPPLTHENGAPMFSTTTFKENGDPIMLNDDGTRSIFCDVDEGAEPTVSDANDLVSEFAGYTAMQFFALADKVASLGYESFAAGLRQDGQVIAEGKYNEQIKTADWKALAEADKRMALAAHACVSVLEGDDALGVSTLRQFTLNQRAA